jgi:hypothetical protein
MLVFFLTGRQMLKSMKTLTAEDSAWEDLQLYKANNVFLIADKGIDRYIANIALTKRPATKGQKFSNKADKNADKINRKKQEKPTEQVKGNEPRQLYRLSIDFRNVNKATLNDCTISLPTLQSIENSFQGCFISTFDITNCFYNIKMNQRSQKYFNFYAKNEIWQHDSLPPGWSSSPKFCNNAMAETFKTKVLQIFLKTKTEEEFPYTHFGQFFTSFVNDLAVHSKQEHGDGIHFLCIEAVFFALKQSGWIISF